MTLAGTNQELTRPFNRKVVLEAVRRHQPVSRAELARLTGLTPQAVSKIAAELTHAGLLRTVGRRRTGRGQPPLDLAVNPSGGFTLGIELTPTAVHGVLVDLAGGVRERESVPLTDPAPATSVPLIAALARRLVDRSGVEERRVLGLGVVRPGALGPPDPDHPDPTVLPGWDEDGACDALSEALGMPVTLDNDATAAAIGEQRYGVAESLSSYVYLFIGEGLGAGLIVDGRPIRGARGMAGEIGHIPVVPGGRACYCGNRGCLERYVSRHALAEHLGLRGGRDLPALDPAEPAIAAWLAEAAGPLRTAITVLENLLDPQTVLVGGHLPGPMLRGLVDHLNPLPPSLAAHPDRTGPRITLATAGEDVSALGAAALPLFESLSPLAAPAAAVAAEGPTVRPPWGGTAADPG